MDWDAIADRQKAFEGSEAHRRLPLNCPVIARLDGRAFHSFTRGMDRPFDSGFVEAMLAATEYLVSKTHPFVAYTQSDEITLIWAPRDDGEFLFGGRTQKLCSVLASMCAARFMQAVSEDRAKLLPHFDCRVWSIPTMQDAIENLRWRQQDARKNAISMAAGAHFSHKALLNKDSKAKLAMLAEAGVMFDEYPAHFREGTFLRRETVMRHLTQEELDRIPPDRRPVGPIERTVVVRLNIDAGDLMRGE